MELSDFIEQSNSYPDPPHEVTDEVKLAKLIVSMDEHGWVGAPIVVDGDQALTGSHRLVARRKVGLDTIPVIEVGDLCAAYGIDWQGLKDEEGDALWAASRLDDLLPREVVDRLGLDLCCA